jgi:hypothetical protein
VYRLSPHILYSVNSLALRVSLLKYGHQQLSNKVPDTTQIHEEFNSPSTNNSEDILCRVYRKIGLQTVRIVFAFLFRNRENFKLYTPQGL